MSSPSSPLATRSPASARSDCAAARAGHLWQGGRSRRPRDQQACGYQDHPGHPKVPRRQQDRSARPPKAQGAGSAQQTVRISLSYLGHKHTHTTRADIDLLFLAANASTSCTGSTTATTYVSSPSCWACVSTTFSRRTTLRPSHVTTSSRSHGSSWGASPVSVPLCPASLSASYYCTPLPLLTSPPLF